LECWATDEFGWHSVDNKVHVHDLHATNDVLRELPLSRSTLERGCREALGRSPNAEINRVRRENAKRLLDDTDLMLQQIAARTGFASVHYFSHSFRWMFGQPPGSYRKRGS
jgi:LacI family transcriptional regulator